MADDKKPVMPTPEQKQAIANGTASVVVTQDRRLSEAQVTMQFTDGDVVKSGVIGAGKGADGKIIAADGLPPAKDVGSEEYVLGEDARKVIANVCTAKGNVGIINTVQVTMNANTIGSLIDHPVTESFTCTPTGAVYSQSNKKAR